VSRSNPPSAPGHIRRCLTDTLGQRKTIIAWFTPEPDALGRRQARIRIDDHPLVTVTVYRRGHVHYKDRPALVTVAQKLGVLPIHLCDVIRLHASDL
jgi:hypothetical protein